MENNVSKDLSNASNEEEVLEVTLSQFRFVKIFNMMLVLCLFILAVGGVWAIGDIFSQNKFGEFLNLSIYSQIFIVGLILLGLFILSIFLTAIYRRGKEFLLTFLFSQSKVKKSIEKFYTTKIILTVWVVSVSAIFVGFVIVIVEFLFGSSNLEVLINFANLTGWVQILLIGGILLLIVIIALLLVWISQNGYRFIFEKIIAKHESVKVSKSYSSAQNNIATRIYATYFILFVICILGIIWSIFDAIMPTGKWTVFLSYSLGSKIIIISSFTTLFFFLLIISILLLRNGVKMVLNLLYSNQELREKNKTSTPIKSAKIAAFSILISIFLIIFALVVWLVSIIFNLSIGQDFGNIFEALQTLSGGLFVISITIVTLVFLTLFLGFIYAFNNGYDLLATRISAAETVIEKNLGAEEPKADKPTKKKTIRIVKS